MLTPNHERARATATVLPLLLPCLLLGLQAGCATYPPSAPRLDHLQGTWESEGSPRKISITIEGDSLYFYEREDFWYKTTFTLPEDTDPAQLHATIRDSAPPVKDVGYVVFAIYKIEDGTLTLAVDDGAEEAPASFSDALSQYTLKSVQPR